MARFIVLSLKEPAPKGLPTPSGLCRSEGEAHLKRQTLSRLRHGPIVSRNTNPVYLAIIVSFLRQYSCKSPTIVR